jgi:hypothetical protein
MTAARWAAGVIFDLDFPCLWFNAKSAAQSFLGMSASSFQQ